MNFLPAEGLDPSSLWHPACYSPYPAYLGRQPGLICTKIKSNPAQLQLGPNNPIDLKFQAQTTFPY